MRKTFVMFLIAAILLFSGYAIPAEAGCSIKSTCACSQGTCCDKGNCTCEGECCKDGNCLCGEANGCKQCSCNKK